MSYKQTEKLPRQKKKKKSVFQAPMGVGKGRAGTSTVLLHPRVSQLKNSLVINLTPSKTSQPLPSYTRGNTL